jgi:predicted DNA-binding transcriptional regulator YafY
MSLNKNALIRYKTIDACLQNRFRKWTLEDLIDACSEALYEYEGIRDGVSRRTVQLDIQLMRSDKLGYNAPIVVIDKKYYRYEDPKYSITDIPLTGQDLDRLTEVASMLRQFKGFSHFREVDDMVSRLQHKVFSGRQAQKVVIDFEKNEHLVGLEHIDPLFQAIIGRKVLYIQYQSFKAREAQELEFHPHLLKEYRNRWFVLGGSAVARKSSTDRSRPVRTDPAPVPAPASAMLALDRIRAITPAPAIPYIEIPGLDASYFEPLIGVTRNANQRSVTVTFWVDAETTPYVRTKPLHPSQQWVEDRGRGAVFSIQVIPNFELERELLGFGASLEVLAPERLRKRMQDILGWAVGRYLK